MGGRRGCLPWRRLRNARGRALWTSVLSADDPTTLLRERSVPRLRELAEIVDRFGRPWREAPKHSQVAGDG
jgi:sulfofructosephosphate aldolase